MLEFSEVLPILRERLEHDLRAAPLSRRQLLATVVTLLDKTLIRVGNDEYVRSNRSYGLTTLRRRHVQVDGATLRFSFRGKSGVEHIVALSEPRLAHIIQRCRDLPGEELFQYLDAAGKRPMPICARSPGATSAPRTSAPGAAPCLPRSNCGAWVSPPADAKPTATSPRRSTPWQPVSATRAGFAGNITYILSCWMLI